MLAINLVVATAPEGESEQVCNAAIRRRQLAILSKHQQRQQREPLLPHAVPDLPCQKIAMDILQFEGKDFLVVIDFFHITLK